MESIADALCETGFDANRNSVAGRRSRLKELRVPMVLRLRPPPKPKPPPRPKKKRIRIVSMNDKVTPKPVTMTADEMLKNPGVDYLDNAGCKALLNKRSGVWNLPMCCGLPTAVDSDGNAQVYCPTHFRIFTQPSAPRLRHG
jgi:hypothetical protein